MSFSYYCVVKIIDFAFFRRTYTVLYQILAGESEGHQSEDVAKYVKARQGKFNNCMTPFGKANKESRAKVESGILTVDGGVKVQVPPEVRPVIWDISSALDLDEQDAFILWKSFLRNRGLVSADLPSDEDIVVHFSDYYYEERLSVLRCIIPLLRSKSDPHAPFHDVAKQVLGEIMPKPRAFAIDLGKQYLLKTTETLPQHIKENPRSVPKYVKRNVRQQFVLLEVLYWTLLEHSLFDGSVADELYAIAFKCDLGNAQVYSNMLLDEEGVQLLKDMETLWVMILVELLQIPQLLSRSPEDTSSDSNLLVSIPEYLTRALDLVYSNVTQRHGCILLAWAAVLFHVSTIDVQERPAYEEISSKSMGKYHELLTYILQPEFGLFQNMRTTLLTSPLFVPSVVLTLNSPVTKSNAIDFRFTFKGKPIEFYQNSAITKTDTSTQVSLLVLRT